MRIRWKSILQYILIYLMFLGNRNGLLVWMYRENGWPVAIGIFILCFGVCIFIKGALNKRLLYFMAALLAIFGIVFITTRGIGLYTYFDIIAWPLLLYVAYNIEHKGFIEKYINVVVIFAFISVLCFIFQQINLDGLLEVLGTPYSDLKFLYYGKWFYTYTAGHAYRNMGMYTEPGLYQIVLNSSLFILLYTSKNLEISRKKQIIYILILVVTCFTTLSTTGLLTMAIIVLGAFWNREVKLKKQLAFLLVVSIAFLFYNYIKWGDESIVEIYIINKLQTTGMNQVASQAHLSSGNARFMAFLVAAKCIISYPLGAGYYNYIYTAATMGYPDIAGNGIAFYCSVLGMLGLILIIYQVIMPAWKFRQSNNAFIIFVIVYILYTTSQEYLVIPAMLIIPYAFRYQFEQTVLRGYK